MEWVGTLISGAFLVVVALIEARAGKDRKAATEGKSRTEKRAARRAEESRLAMKMQDANLDLTTATAIAVRDGKCNGEMKAAMIKVTAAQNEYEEFIRRLAAEQATKI